MIGAPDITLEELLLVSHHTGRDVRVMRRGGHSYVFVAGHGIFHLDDEEQVIKLKALAKS